MILSTVTKFATVLAMTLALGACSSNQEAAPDPNTGNASNTAQPSGPRAGTLEEFMVTVGDRVFFDTALHTLDAESQEVLRRQAGWLVENAGASIAVEGHADERGTRAYNLALGERRANSARNYLVNLGVPSNRVTIVSYGKERPESDALCSNESCWWRNRRALTVVSGVPSS